MSGQEVTNGTTYGKTGDKLHLLPGGSTKTYDGVTSEETKEKPKEKPEKVPFFSLFRFADKWDVLLIIGGLIGSAGNGLSWPYAMLLFAEVIDQFVDQGKFDNLLDKIPDDVFDILNTTWEDARTDIEGFVPYCPLVAELLNTTLDCEFLDGADNVFDAMEDKAVIFTVGGIVLLFCCIAQVYFFIVSSERQIVRIRLAFYRNVLRQEMAWFDTFSPGDLGVKLTDDISKIHDAIGDKVSMSINYFVLCIGSLAVCYTNGWELTLILQIGGPVMCVAFAITGYMIATMTTKERKAYASAGKISEEVLSSIRTVQAFHGQEKETKRYVESLAEAKKFGIKKSLVSGTAQGVSWFIIFCDYALGFWYGGRLVRHGDYTVKEMMTVIYFREYTRVGTRRVFFSVFQGSASLGLAAPILVSINVGRGAAYAVFKIIDKILNGFDLTINPGQTVALVGASGCGKSTLIQLMMRFYDPDNGKVTVKSLTAGTCLA
ncbi:Multidrug resistance protein 1 [Bulinus truncatus]|nr:Multidrug resistance protein 1 [Bulinus truncatus]